MNVGKRTTLKFIIQSRYMSDPTLPDIDLKIKWFESELLLISLNETDLSKMIQKRSGFIIFELEKHHIRSSNDYDISKSA